MTTASNRVSKPLMFDLLSALTSIRVGDIPLPKYRYPSGGSLYPVQTYVQAKAQGAGQWPPGSYYLDPEKCRLVSISDHCWSFEPNGEDDGDIAIILVAKYPAVQPVYGALAEEFCAIEAGYMAQLLRAQARASGLKIGSVKLPSAREAENIAIDCQLEPDSAVVCALFVSPGAEQKIVSQVLPADAASVTLAGGENV